MYGSIAKVGRGGEGRSAGPQAWANTRQTANVNGATGGRVVPRAPTPECLLWTLPPPTAVGRPLFTPPCYKKQHTSLADATPHAPSKKRRSPHAPGQSAVADDAPAPQRPPVATGGPPPPAEKGRQSAPRASEAAADARRAAGAIDPQGGAPPLARNAPTPPPNHHASLGSCRHGRVGEHEQFWPA